VDCAQYKDEIVVTIENTVAGREALGLIDFLLSHLLENEPAAHIPVVHGDTQLRIAFAPDTSKKKVTQVKREIDAQLHYLGKAYPTYDDLMNEKAVSGNEVLCKGIQATEQYLDTLVERLESEDRVVLPKERIALRNAFAEHWVKHHNTASDTPEAYSQVAIDYLVNQMLSFKQLAADNPFLSALATRAATPYAAAAVDYTNENDLNITYSEAVGVHKALRESFIKNHPAKTTDKVDLSGMYADAVVAYFKKAKIDVLASDMELKEALSKLFLKTAKKLQAEAQNAHP